MSRRFTLIVVLGLTSLALAVFAGLVWANTLFARQAPAGKQFLVPWLGARTFLQYGISPYDDRAAQRAQVVYYGRLAAEDEDELSLSLPLPLEMLYIPFGLIQDASLARGIWMALGECAIVGAVLLALSLTGWKPRRFLLPAVLFFFIAWVYGAHALVDGSAAPLIALAVTGALAAARTERDELAGALLVLTLLEPALAAFFLLFMLWWVVRSRRWRILLGFGMLFVLLTLLSFLIVPSWFVPFLRAVLSHFRANPGLSLVTLMETLWGGAGLRVGVFLSVAVVMLVIREWVRLRGEDFRHVTWVACLTLAAAPLIGLPTSLDGHLLLFLPLALIFAVAAERWHGLRAAFVSAGVLVILFLLLWLIAGHLHTLFLLLPILILIGLYWMRWWSVRPPRTLADTLRK